MSDVCVWQDMHTFTVIIVAQLCIEMNYFKLNRNLLNVELRTRGEIPLFFLPQPPGFLSDIIEKKRNNCYCYNIQLKDRTGKLPHPVGCFTFCLKIYWAHMETSPLSMKDSRIQTYAQHLRPFEREDGGLIVTHLLSYGKRILWFHSNDKFTKQKHMFSSI